MKDSFQNHMDELFRSRLQFYKKEPGKHVWENIETELDKEENSTRLNKNKVYFKKAGSALILMFFLGSLILYYRIYVSQPVQSSATPSGLHTSETRKRTQPAAATDPLAKIASQPLYEPVYAGKQNIHRLILESPESGITEISNTDFHVVHADSGAWLFHPDFIPTVPAKNIVHLLTYQPLNVKASGTLRIIQPQHPRFMDRLSVTPYFSQEFAGYNFDDDEVTAPNGKEVERAERNIFSASVGLYVNYKLSKNWMLQSGISYSWSRSVMDSSQSYAVLNNSGEVAFKLNTASGFSFLHSPSFIVPMVGDSLATARTHNELHYITVPLVLSYRIPFRRFTILAGAGITYNILTHATLETDIYGTNFRQNESEIPLRGLKKTNFGLLVKAEIQYRLTSKLAFSLIPSFKNTLGPINMNNTSLRAYPYNFGIGGGIVYSF